MLQFLLTITDESNYSKVERIYNTYHDAMMRYALSKFNTYKSKNCQYDAEDAVQSAFLKIVKHIDNIDFSRGEKDVKNYVFSILTNEIYIICGQEKENFDIFDIFEEFCLENEYNFIEDIEIQERYTELVKAVEALDEKYSTTLFLVLCKGMTVNQVAEMMGISAKTIYTRLYRGKELLLDSLKGAKTNG